MLSYGVLTNYADLYRMELKRERIISIPGIGYGTFDQMIASVEKSRRCHLYQLLVAVGIPKLGPAQARSLDEYFLGSWDDFERAIREGFAFSHIEGISQQVEKNIRKWYEDPHEEKLWRPVLREISFIGNQKEIGEAGNPFKNANVTVTGTVNGMNRKDLQELLMLLGAEVSEAVNKNTTYLIVGAEPGTEKLAAALSMGVKIITEGHFAKMLAGTEVKEED